MPRVNAGDEVGRNDPCPCGSGKKYKKCCMGKASPRRPAPAAQRPGTREQLQAAADHARAGRLEQAEQAYEQVLAARPHEAEALSGLARIKNALNRPKEAVELARGAVAADGRRAELHVLLSSLLLTLSRVEEAERAARRALQLEPKNAPAHRLIAECHHRMHRLDDAISWTKKSLALEPDSTDGEIFLAILLKQNGEHDEARRRLERVLGRPLDHEVRSRALKELGFALDKLGEYDGAFDSFEQGNLEMAGTSAAGQVDRDASLQMVADYKAVATPELLSKWTAGDFDDGLPRAGFLVGFPRSGTTLTEQVLGAHPGIVTADEKPVLEPVVKRMMEWFAGEGIADMLPQLDRDDVLRLRAEYWKQAGSVMNMDLSDTVFVDKLPLNLIHLPLINTMFPDARVIVALRDPRDVCLSCFMQRLGLNPAMINFLWWERTAEYYAAVMDLWLHLREMIALEYLEIRYEDTVEDFERQARRLIDFLGVPWDEAVLAYHEKARQKVIATPSFTAVTQKIYRGALARWRHYPAAVERVSGTLQRFVTAFGYG
jgi:Tfp pilus assembly protein PilF